MHTKAKVGMRFALIRYIDAGTDWVPRFAFLNADTGQLLKATDDDPWRQGAHWFYIIDDAIAWIRYNYPTSSIEWEGTTF